MTLERATAGEVFFKGQDITRLSGRALKAVRRNIQMVFQDPYTSLNPRMTVGDIIGEPFEIHPEVAPKGDRRRKVQELLDVVGLNPEYINRYPHQFSGGQRQRIGIARGLALSPEIIICDEPVSALDVSVQAQVINLMEKLQDEFNLSYIFIAHDLSIVRHISDRVGVMYLGKMAEIGTDTQIYDHPTHPYTQALLSAVPVPDPEAREGRERIILAGDVPSPANPPSGCRFRTRCWKAQDMCATEVPLLAVPERFKSETGPVAARVGLPLRRGEGHRARGLSPVRDERTCMTGGSHTAAPGPEEVRAPPLSPGTGLWVARVNGPGPVLSGGTWRKSGCQAPLGGSWGREVP